MEEQSGSVLEINLPQYRHLKMLESSSSLKMAAVPVSGSLSERVKDLEQFLIISAVALVGVFASSVTAVAQNFSCSFGQPACLDYGDKVCSSQGKCVDEYAACFDQYACDYEGFTCKSNLTDLATEYDDLVYNYNNLVSEHDALRNDAEELSDNYQRLFSEYEDAVSEKDYIKSCVASASTISDAQYCF